MLMAYCAKQSCAAAPVLHLRELNPYVAATAEDWAYRGLLSASIPRQSGPGIGLSDTSKLAGDYQKLVLCSRQQGNTKPAVAALP